MRRFRARAWIPACAGMTEKGTGMTENIATVSGKSKSMDPSLRWDDGKRCWDDGKRYWDDGKRYWDDSLDFAWMTVFFLRHSKQKHVAVSSRIWNPCPCSKGLV